LGAEAVYKMGRTVDPKYPIHHTDDPRHRGIDWSRLWPALRGELDDDTSEVDLFVKTRGEPVDALYFIGLGPALSERLRQVFALVDDDVEWVPLGVNGERFWFMRVVTVLDALDVERSEMRVVPGGTSSHIVRPVWRDGLRDPALFRVPQDRVALLATPAVAGAYEESGCTGLHFSVWGAVGAGP
jgi:hypothetical protein